MSRDERIIAAYREELAGAANFDDWSIIKARIAAKTGESFARVEDVCAEYEALMQEGEEVG